MVEFLTYTLSIVLLLICVVAYITLIGYTLFGNLMPKWMGGIVSLILASFGISGLPYVYMYIVHIVINIVV